ncbi:S8 family serine peptidase [Rheinheimera nanhaiensis]|uniref:S8 family serine peptidase n=1 Tax=Rheinheimera nanhaiensis TaxID=1163621 RepID=UPI001ED9C611|nr:S8 family serine peptidase [Rheinheimera nanhaiensis]
MATAATAAERDLAGAPNRLILTLEQGVSAQAIQPDLHKLSAVSAAGHSAAANTTALRDVQQFSHLPQLALVKLAAGTDIAAIIAQYKTLPGVKAAEPDYRLRTTQSSNDPLFNQQWHLQTSPGINAQAAWDSSTGDAQVIVAVIDTGVDYSHPDLQANIWQNPEEIAGDGIDNDGNGYVDDIYGINPADDNVDPMDEDGHGTQVAGIIGAVGNNSTGVAGVNWSVTLLPCRFMDVNGEGFVSDAIACLNYVLALKQRGENIVATNNSWGGPVFSQALYNAVQAHYDAGILFVASAGNDNTQAPFYPAAFDLPNVISVSAHGQSGSKADFANYGRNWVDLSAPGVAIYTTDLDNQYSLASGTSMAAPVVTGVAALLSAAEPGLNANQLRARLLISGVTATDSVLSSQTATGHLLLASGDGQDGALECMNKQLTRRLLPLTDTVFLSAGATLPIEVLSLDCAGNSINTTVSIAQGGAVALNDDAQQQDKFAGDGIYSGSWTFDGNDAELQFADGPVQVLLRNDNFCAANNVSEIPLAECETLVQLYYDTGGQSWLNSTNWLQNNTPCSWFGVACSSGRVASLNLSDNGLVGQLPANFNQLSALTELDLSFNALQGNFPAALLQLTQLSRLQLWNNAFEGSIPAGLANLTALTELDLSFNRFSGSLPAGLGNLPLLRELFVENNYLSGTVPSALGQLSQLQILWLENNDFSGTLPSTLTNLNQLRAFSFAGTELCAPATADFGNWLAQIEQLFINTDCANSAPQVSAGSAQTVSSGSVVTLTGTASDSDFNVLSYQWQQLAGPSVSLSQADTLTASFTAPVVSSTTSLRFRLTVDDGIAQSSAEVTITVQPTGGSGGNAGGGSGGGSLGIISLLLLGLLLLTRLGKSGLTAYNARPVAAVATSEHG